MKHKLLLLIFLILVFTVCGTLFADIKKDYSSQVDELTYTYIEGTVTAYDTSPTNYDAPIILKIDNKSINVGGGFGGGDATSKLYSPITVGDRVEAKLLTIQGQLSMIGCEKCYIKRLK